MARTVGDIVTWVVAALLAGTLSAAEGGGTGGERPMRERGVREMRGGPYRHKVLSASSRDGLVWRRDAGVRVEHASVPSAVADGNRIWLYYVDADRGPGRAESVGCAISTDGIEFVKQPFTIEGMAGRKAVDPSVWRDPDGKFRLYYLASNAPGDPASAEGKHEIHLALSDDGVHFQNVGRVFRYAKLVDPDVFYYKGRWFMYVFAGGQTIIATSADGRDFTYKQAFALRGWGTVAPVELADGRLRLYAFGQGKPGGNAVRSFISSNGLDWAAEEGERITGGKNEQVTDPFVIRWKDGWKMYFKVEERREGFEPRAGREGKGINPKS